MKIPFVDLKAQYLSIKNEIDSAIQNVINESAFIKGKFVQKFEEEYADIYGVKHCISCANGTDAIYIALKVLRRIRSSGLRPDARWLSSTPTSGPGSARLDVTSGAFAWFSPRAPRLRRAPRRRAGCRACWRGDLRRR